MMGNRLIAIHNWERKVELLPGRRVDMGSVYRRGNMWWVKYYRNGKSYRESSQSDRKEVAKRLLKSREGEISEGRMPGICFDRVNFEALSEDYLTDYRVNQRSTLNKAERCARYLGAEFGGMRVPQINTSRVKRYIERRLEAGMANASINRELAALKRMFNLAAQWTPPKVAQVPHIPMLKENNTRKGFFEHEQFLALREALPDHLRPVATFGYLTGWRREEILGLEWKQVDIKEGTVRLEPGETKNDSGRTLYMEPELLEMMKELFTRRRLDCPYVFHLDGKQIKDFRKAWKKACQEAGIVGMLFHDFRRTAVRNMVRAGIPERVAMEISGHKTRAVFDRYNITSQEDLKEAAKKR
jgi:integrase